MFKALLVCAVVAGAVWALPRYTHYRLDLVHGKNSYGVVVFKNE